MPRRLAILLGVLVALGLSGAALIRLAESGATEFRVEGETLVIAGLVSGAATERLERLMAQTCLTRVLLGDMPGTDDLTWFLGMGLLIRSHGLETVAEGVLINYAILLFAAGERRVLAGGELVLHSDALARAQGHPVDRRPATVAERARYAERMLDDAGFAAFFEETRATRDRHALSEAELERFGLLTGG
ncbi:hypothetical protein HKCCSP123_12615 [Rhodobacterales bacterium HKCCSP123]|nr:hypothetical protein [Rhodobacterales bacterium HKCCSP123]